MKLMYGIVHLGVLNLMLGYVVQEGYISPTYLGGITAVELFTLGAIFILTGILMVFFLGFGRYDDYSSPSSPVPDYSYTFAVPKTEPKERVGDCEYCRLPLDFTKKSCQHCGAPIR